MDILTTAFSLAPIEYDQLPAVILRTDTGGDGDDVDSISGPRGYTAFGTTVCRGDGTPPLHWQNGGISSMWTQLWLSVGFVRVAVTFPVQTTSCVGFC